MAHSTNLQNQIGPSHMQKLLIYKTNLRSQVIYISPSTSVGEEIQGGGWIFLQSRADQTSKTRGFPNQNSQLPWQMILPLITDSVFKGGRWKSKQYLSKEVDGKTWQVAATSCF